MVTHHNIDALRTDDDLHMTRALTHGDMMKLLKEKVIEMDLFDEQTIQEVDKPSEPGRRYCLCRNLATAKREGGTRQRLLALTAVGLKEIAACKRKTTVETLGVRVGKVVAKYKMGKFIQWSVEADEVNTLSQQHRLMGSINTEKVAHEPRFDGGYLISTNTRLARCHNVAMRVKYEMSR